MTPTRPVSAAGIRIDPAPSVPNAMDVTPAATLAAAPALEPPAVNAGFQGLRVLPVSGDSPTALHPYSLVVVLPTTIAPAARRRSTAGASMAATWLVVLREPSA